MAFNDQLQQFVVGYGGLGGISFNDNKYYSSACTSTGFTIVPMLNANIKMTHNIPTANPYYQPFKDDTVKSPFRMGYGTYAFDGSVSFQITSGTIASVFNQNFIKRYNMFRVGVYDGEKTCKMNNCVWNNVSITGQANSVVTCSISFLSNNGYQETLSVTSGNGIVGTFNTNDLLIPYWQCGIENSGVVSFSITFDKSVNPVYLNNNYKVPTYLRVGMVNVNVSVQSYNKVGDCTKIYIGSNALVLSSSIETSMQCDMNTLNDAGLIQYNWTVIASSSTNKIFSFQ